MEQPGVVAANLGLRFSLHFLSIFVHISGSISPITLIWASLEISSSPSEVEHRWCQFWSKVMTSEVEERPRVVTALYGCLGVNGLNSPTTISSNRSTRTNKINEEILVNKMANNKSCSLLKLKDVRMKEMSKITWLWLIIIQVEAKKCIRKQGMRCSS